MKLPRASTFCYVAGLCISAESLLALLSALWTLVRGVHFERGTTLLIS